MTFPAMPTLRHPSGWPAPARITCPFTRRCPSCWACRLAQGQRPVLVTVHSFTPVYFGQPRAVEFGVIHDADDRLACAIARQETGLLTRLNEPYSAADGVARRRRAARHALGARRMPCWKSATT